ncbi:MAG: hypothetical protein AUK43_12515 [Oscillatoriales cyanobacterium CG2_30_40_61]|nr:MAG: hypothetical protein AUK43_12515 [Oscillatoriales cyanobacterium CG2_30_40_61]
MSEIIVLDTHIWFWWVNREFDRFSDKWREEIETANQVGISPVSCFEIASRAVNLSPIHKDPFDRIIIATALVYQANLASIDSVFSQYSELDTYLMK